MILLRFSSFLISALRKIMNFFCEKKINLLDFFGRSFSEK